MCVIFNIFVISVPGEELPFFPKTVMLAQAPLILFRRFGGEGFKSTRPEGSSNQYQRLLSLSALHFIGSPSGCLRPNVEKARKYSRPVDSARTSGTAKQDPQYFKIELKNQNENWLLVAAASTQVRQQHVRLRLQSIMRDKQNLLIPVR